MSNLTILERPWPLLLLLTLATLGCQNHSPSPTETRATAEQNASAGAGLATADQSADLYDALGKRDGIERLVEDLMHFIVDDKRIAPQFKGLNVERFHSNLSDQICELAGGPCQYEGMAMTESHHGITETQFNALVEDLILAMEKNGIATGTQNRLLAKLAPLHPAIVDR
ncbi:MAG: group 1 truncated hemoglobin [Oleiphilaceae bacterium]|nr:group 1 truncated hemoglobin [Oleiphilaceae bacterium]